MSMENNKIFYNVLTNWGFVVVNTIFSFVIRTIIVRKLGIDFLGVNTGVVEVVNLLSISEVGIQNAILYKMYKPVIDGDIERQNQLFALYKKAYMIVAVIIMCVGIVVSLFLGEIIKTSIDLKIVYGAYYLQLFSVVLSYLFGYYNLIFISRQKVYLISLVNTLANIIVYGLQLYALLYKENYLLFVSCSILGRLLSFWVLRRLVMKHYKLIVKKTAILVEDKKNLLFDIKNLVVSVFSGYIYGSTDAILISAFFGTILTGMISNYKMLANLVRNVMMAFAEGIVPSFGILLNKDSDEKIFKKYFEFFIYLEFVIGTLFLLPMLLLCDDFIVVWIGKEYVISRHIFALIIMDFQFSSLNIPTCLIMKNVGMFKEEKVISVIAAISNIVTSIIGAKLIGCKGIFIGTLIAVMEYWIYRSFVLIKRLIKEYKKYYLLFWKNNIFYVAIFYIAYWLFNKSLAVVETSNSIATLFLKAVILEMVIVIALLAMTMILHKDYYLILLSKIRRKRYDDN